MKNLAIIPARSGSKGLPDKNIMPLCGKPLLTYSVDAALQSGIFDTVHVSTDSANYAEIAKSCGADVPFLRSEKNSSDTASSWDAAQEVLDRYSDLGKQFDNFMLLQPTSPLRTSADIAAAFALMEKKRAEAVVSVCPASYPPVWYYKLSKEGVMKSFIRNGAHQKRRQDAEPFFRVNGAIYLIHTTCFKKNPDISRGTCFAYLMGKERSIDIDDNIDFLFAEAVLTRRDEWRESAAPAGHSFRNAAKGWP